MSPSGPTASPALSLPDEGGTAAVVLPGGKAPKTPLVIDADSGPVFVVGQASETFRYGFDVSCRIGARFGIGILRIDTSLRTGYARLSPAGLVGGALHLISLGPEIGLVLPESAPLRFRCRLGCGLGDPRKDPPLRFRGNGPRFPARSTVFRRPRP